MRTAPGTNGRVAYVYSLQFPDRDGPLQAGILVGQETREAGRRPMLRWTSEHFFVPPSLWGAGLGSGFISTLLAQESVLEESGIDVIEVFVVSRFRERSAMYRDDRIAFVEFYRSAGFTTVDSGTHSSLPEAAKSLLRDPLEVDTWTTMRWVRSKGL